LAIVIAILFSVFVCSKPLQSCRLSKGSVFLETLKALRQPEKKLHIKKIKVENYSSNIAGLPQVLWTYNWVWFYCLLALWIASYISYNMYVGMYASMI